MVRACCGSLPRAVDSVVTIRTASSAIAKTQAQWPVSVMPDSRGYMPTDATFGLPLEKAIPNRLQPVYVESTIFRAFTKLMDEYISLND